MMQFPRKELVSALLDRSWNGRAKVITGLRRSGKSYLLFHLLPPLLEERFPDAHVHKFSFERPDDIDLLEGFLPERPLYVRVNGRKLVDQRKFRAYLRSLLHEEGRHILLLDEVQGLEDFALVLGGALTEERVDLFVTGSNAHLLSSDIGTEFSGRGEPFSLRSLRFREVMEESALPFEECYRLYSRYGGLPPVWQEKDDRAKEEYLSRLVEETYLRDLLLRHKVRDEGSFRGLLRFLASSVGSLVSPHRIEETFKGKGARPYAHEAIARHLRYFEDAFLIEESPRFDVVGKRHLVSSSKWYFRDLGVRNALLSFREYSSGHLMENIVEDELRARGYDVETAVLPYALRGERGKGRVEVDFKASRGPLSFYVQSCYRMEEEWTLARETRPLLAIRDAFPKMIVFFGEGGTWRDEDGILRVPLKDFLAGDILNCLERTAF